MWKWTEYIDLIIVDDFSLANEIVEYDYQQIDSRFKVVKLSSIQIESTQKKLLRNRFLYDALVKITQGQIKSMNIVAITSDIEICKEAIAYRIGTIYVNENTPITESRNLPDFFVHNLNEVIKCLSGNFIGYASEVLSLPFVKLENAVLKLVKYNLKSCDKSFDLYAGGRYYAVHNEYLRDDTLSKCIIEFKKNRFIDHFNRYFDDLILYINDIIEVNIVCSVPLKPLQINEGKENRFEKMRLVESSKICNVNHNILKCIKDYQNKSSNLHEREKNVEGAYLLNANVKDKHIVLIDDIYTTGTTVKEIVRILYLNGAKHVTVVVIAINQQINSNYDFTCFKCIKCNSDMKIRCQRKEDALFWGCSKYFDDYEKCTNLINLEEGLIKTKIANSRVFLVKDDFEEF